MHGMTALLAVEDLYNTVIESARDHSLVALIVLGRILINSLAIQTSVLVRKLEMFLFFIFPRELIFNRGT